MHLATCKIWGIGWMGITILRSNKVGGKLCNSNSVVKVWQPGLFQDTLALDDIEGSGLLLFGVSSLR